MKYFILFLIFGSVVFTSCKNRKRVAEQNALMETDSSHNADTSVISDAFSELENEFDFDEPIVFAYLEKGACFGKCPIFKATIYSDGKATYKGIRFVDKEGYFEGKVSDEVLEQIELKALALGVDTMKNEYDGPITDIPMIYIGTTMNSEYKHIKKRYQYPKELKTYQDYLDGIFDVIEWKKAKEPVEDKE